MAQKVITIILVLIIIGGLAWYIDKIYLQPSKSQENLSKVPKYAATKLPGDLADQVQPELVYITDEDAKVIWAVGADKEGRRLFTDADETDKIIKVSNLASMSNEVLAVMSESSESNVGKLVAIDLNTQDDKILQSSFLVPDEWSVSSDGKKIIFVRFSNIEESYGYTLYSQERDGSNTRELVNSQKIIKNPVWNADGNKIAYITINETKTELNIFNLDRGSGEKIKDFDNVSVDNLSFTGDKIILSVRDIDSTDSGVIEIINQDGSNLEKITDYSGGIANFIYCYDVAFLGYIVSQYESNPDDTTTGQIYIYKIKNEEKEPIQKGTQILGWKVAD